MGLPESLKAVLVCPKCKGALDIRENEARCVCKACDLSYPIKDGVPVLLIEKVGAAR